jgi:hypothetical protein
LNARDFGPQLVDHSPGGDLFICDVMHRVPILLKSLLQASRSSLSCAIFAGIALVSSTARAEVEKER